MDEKIFLSDKESKTIAELKAIGGINIPVFKDGQKMYKTSLDGLLSTSQNTVILPYETATYAIINEIAQSGKQVIIYYTGVDGAQFWTLSHKTAELSYVFTWVNGNSLVKMIMSSGNVWTEEVIDIKGIPEAPNDGLSYARISKAWKAISSPIDITDDFELINGMSTNNVGDLNRLRVIYVPSTDMVQITGNLFSPSSKPYDSWLPCMRYTGDLLSFNLVSGGNMNMGLGEPPIYGSVRAIMSSAFIGNSSYTDKIFAFKGIMSHNNISFYGVSVSLTCYGCRAAKLAEIAAAELANSGE